MIKNAEVYITGGSGQLGKVLRKYLFQKGINTKVLSRKIINLYENEEHINFCFPSLCRFDILIDKQNL